MTDIDQLKKAFQQAITTSASVAASNEPLSRRDAVQSGQVFSAPVVQGGLGSWVASSGYPFSSVTPDGVQLGATAPSRNSFETTPGLPGVPDVDFVPYNWNTNRFGGKGGALLGHPISWEVVGPTLKSPYCDWQWNINTAGANDVLTLVAGPNPLGGAPASVQAAYNLSANFDLEGGLYVLFTFTGENFTGALTALRSPITSSDYRDSYELFRVDGYNAFDITLRSEKRISDYFGVPASPSCRAITLIRPKVTRLAALPAPVNGQQQANRIFVFLPPEVSATSEYNPPYNAGAGSWLGGGFDVAGALPAGQASDYGGANPLPVPRPVAEVGGTIDPAAVGDPAKWVVNVSSAPTPLPPIVRVYGVTRASTSALANGSNANCLGYFYITKTAGAGPVSLTLRRVPEVDPDTGSVFWGNGPYDSGPGSVDVRVQFFEDISSVFFGAALNYQKLAAARLTNLIDPRTAGPSIAYRDTSGGNAVPASKPDRAIFNTKPGENPGNLLDLGFRAVYFPAKVDPVLGPDAVPDFDQPLDSEDVQLTANPTSRQYIETDYSAGVAYLSETPDAGASYCQVAPTTAPFTAPNNPRREIVLFAACVPYSMEEDQTGDGIRVTASSLKSIEVGFGEDDLADVYGRRIITDCLTAPGAFTPPGSLLTDLASLTDIPPSGFFFLVDATGGALTTPRVGPYYYQSTSLAGTVQLDGISGPAPAYTITGDTKIVLQRSLRSFAPTSASADTVRGSSKRISALSFKGADVTFGADGSVSIEPRTTLQKAYEAGRTIDVTAAVGSVRIRNNTDPTGTLQIQRSPTVPSTTGSGLDIGMNANTSGDALAIQTSGEGAGIAVSHLGTLVGADGISIDQGAATSAYGLRVTMTDVASAGYGVSILHNGTFGALDIVHSGTVGTANGAQISLTGATAATGLLVSVANAGATGDALDIKNSGSGRGATIQVSGPANAIEVYDAANLLRVAASPAGVLTASDGGLNSGQLGPFACTVSDGTDTSTVDATSVTSGAFLYPTPNPSREIVVSFVGQMAAYGMRGGFSSWDRGAGSDTTARYIVGQSINASTVLDLNGILRRGIRITDIELWVDVAALGIPSSGGFQATLLNSFSSAIFPGAPPLPITTIASVTATAATGWQQLSMAASLGGGHTVLGNRDYWLTVRNNNSSPGDEVHAIIIRFNDPGPRNF